MRRDSFERFYYEKVALGEGCGCAEYVTRMRDLEAFAVKAEARGIAWSAPERRPVWLRLADRLRRVASINCLLQSTVVLALVSLCAPALAQTLHGTLYKDQNCPCCEGHARYLMRRGIDVDIKPVGDIAAISKGAGIPRDYQGCHTLMLEGYAVEGHVTVEIIQKLLKERPADVVGISLPEMPTGVPGMGGPYLGPYKVYAIKKDGTASVFATQ